jgi:hypothetical protein
MRALRVELVLDMYARDSGGGEFAHRAHRMQRFAETGAGIGDQRHRYRTRHLAGDAHLLVHCQQRFADRARGAADIAAGIDERRAGGFG